jgi:hypothetical protein
MQRQLQITLDRDLPPRPHAPSFDAMARIFGGLTGRYCRSDEQCTQLPGLIYPAKCCHIGQYGPGIGICMF